MDREQLAEENVTGTYAMTSEEVVRAAHPAYYQDRHDVVYSHVLPSKGIFLGEDFDSAAQHPSVLRYWEALRRVKRKYTDSNIRHTFDPAPQPQGDGFEEWWFGQGWEMPSNNIEQMAFGRASLAWSAAIASRVGR